ncbi:hypothetical protein TNCV_2168221 [Trichonephila clavipes]|nr:hypothetical protein TNCV_2168221 [Trichonephila clavipes]
MITNLLKLLFPHLRVEPAAYTTHYLGEIMRSIDHRRTKLGPLFLRPKKVYNSLHQVGPGGARRTDKQVRRPEQIHLDTSLPVEDRFQQWSLGRWLERAFHQHRKLSKSGATSEETVRD